MAAQAPITSKRRTRPFVSLCRLCLRPISHPSGIHDELVTCPGGAPAMMETALYEQFMLRLGRRHRFYELVRDAGEAGITHQSVAEMGITCPMVHVESLRFDGVRVDVLSGKTTEGRFERRFYLGADGWAGE